jgi:hypothetical protein
MVLYFQSMGQFGIGLEGGPDLNFLRTSISNISYASYVPKVGYDAGILLRYSLWRYFTIGADPSFISKGYELKWSGNYIGMYQTNRNTYWALPLTTSFHHEVGKFRFSIGGGGYSAYWAGGRIKGVLPNLLNDTGSPNPNGGTYLDSNTLYSYNKPYPFSKQKDERLEFGWLARLGAAYTCHRQTLLFLDLTYLQSATDQQKRNYTPDQIPRYNRTWLLTLGVLLNAKGLFKNSLF